MTMMRWWLCSFVVLGLTVLAVPPAEAEDDLDIPGLDAADLRGDALLWEDATIYLEPWDTGVSIRLQSFGRGRREEVGRAVPIRIVDSSLRAFVEIELPGRTDCTWRRLDADARLTGLRLFVRREDLAPVLVKPFAAQYSDGTRIKVAVGAPVVPVVAGGYMISARGDKLRLPIPHSSVGYLYKAGKVLESEIPTGKLVRVDRSVNARIGDESFALRSYWFSPVPAKKTDVALVHWTTRCVDMVAEVPASSLRPSDAPHLPPVPTTTITPARGAVIPMGVPVSTCKLAPPVAGEPQLCQLGREVAVAGKDIAVSVPSADTTCFESKLSLVREDEPYATLARALRLCAATALVQR